MPSVGSLVFLATATLDYLLGLLVDAVGDLSESSLLQQILFWSRFLVAFDVIRIILRFLWGLIIFLCLSNSCFWGWLVGLSLYRRRFTLGSTFRGLGGLPTRHSCLLALLSLALLCTVLHRCRLVLAALRNLPLSFFQVQLLLLRNSCSSLWTFNTGFPLPLIFLNLFDHRIA